MPESVKQLTQIIALLPGIGEKTALKLSLFLLESKPAYVHEFQKSLSQLQEQVDHCSTCHALKDTKDAECTFCTDVKRDTTVLCVVEEFSDLLAIEQSGSFRGRYHVLGGHISPASGVGPSDLTYELLFGRLEGVEEIIVATNPNFEGEATALYLKEHIPNKDIRLTRPSRGLPSAGYIEYADEGTLLSAMQSRQQMK